MKINFQTIKNLPKRVSPFSGAHTSVVFTENDLTPDMEFDFVLQNKGDFEYHKGRRKLPERICVTREPGRSIYINGIRSITTCFFKKYKKIMLVCLLDIEPPMFSAAYVSDEQLNFEDIWKRFPRYAKGA